MSMMMMIVGGRAGSGPGVHVRRILSDPRSESSVAPREGGAALHFGGLVDGTNFGKKIFF